MGAHVMWILIAFFALVGAVMLLFVPGLAIVAVLALVVAAGLVVAVVLGRSVGAHTDPDVIERRDEFEQRHDDQRRAQ
ncbi:MAG: hypothetical protein JWM90_1533 [Thermoleophilia bacterium]|nr:hypothetical protein [Thermoleophilia bacterium]